MKTRYIFALSLLALVFSCGKDVEPDLVSGPDDLVTISAILPDAPATRGAGLETKLSWTWNAGDKITVIGETTEVFKIKEGFSPKKAEFVGRPVKGKTFTMRRIGASRPRRATTAWLTSVMRRRSRMSMTISPLPSTPRGPQNMPVPSSRPAS